MTLLLMLLWQRWCDAGVIHIVDVGFVDVVISFNVVPIATFASFISVTSFRVRRCQYEKREDGVGTEQKKFLLKITKPFHDLPNVKSLVECGLQLIASFAFTFPRRQQHKTTKLIVHNSKILGVRRLGLKIIWYLTLKSFSGINNTPIIPFNWNASSSALLYKLVYYASTDC